MACEWKIVAASKGHCDGPMRCRFGLKCREFATGHCSFVHPGEEPGYPGPPFVQTKSQAKKRRAVARVAAEAAHGAAEAAARAAFMEAFPVMGRAPEKVAPLMKTSYASALAKGPEPAKVGKLPILVGGLPASVGCRVDMIRMITTEAVAATAASSSGWLAADEIW